MKKNLMITPFLSEFFYSPMIKILIWNVKQNCFKPIICFSYGLIKLIYFTCIILSISILQIICIKYQNKTYYFNDTC